jgi:hypothetical protein
MIKKVGASMTIVILAVILFTAMAIQTKRLLMGS